MGRKGPWNSEWGTYGCAVAYMKGLTTAQLVLSTVCIAAQIILFFLCQKRWECIVFPSSVSSILYLLGATVGIIGLARRQKSMFALYLLIGSAAILSQVILVILSREYIYDIIWTSIADEFSIWTIAPWCLVVVSALELLLYICSSLVTTIALTRYNPAFKDKLLGFKTSTIRRKPGHNLYENI